MSTAAAIVLTAYTLGMAALFACTRNGRHGADQPAGVRDALRALAAAGHWHARYWACRPRLWWRLHRMRRAARGCIATPLLAPPETLPLRVADPEPEEVPAPDTVPPLRGRAPYPLRETSPQAALTLPDPRWIPETDYAPYAPYVPDVIS